MFGFLKKNSRVEFLTGALAPVEFEEVRHKLSKAFHQSGNFMGYDIDEPVDWLFIRRKGGKGIVLAVAIKYIREGVYLLTNFTDIQDNPRWPVKLEERTQNLHELFAKAVEYAEKSLMADVLFFALPNSISIRSAAKAGFTADILFDEKFKEDVSDIRQEIIWNNRRGKDLVAFQKDVVDSLRSRRRTKGVTFDDNSPSLEEELRILELNAEYIEQKAPEKSYRGLIAAKIFDE